jgi:hypothetical protein
MDQTPPELAQELLALTYMRLVEDTARQAFDTNRTAEFLAVAHQVCADCGVEPVGHALVERPGQRPRRTVRPVPDAGHTLRIGVVGGRLLDPPPRQPEKDVRPWMSRREETCAAGPLS